MATKNPATQNNGITPISDLSKVTLSDSLLNSDITENLNSNFIDVSAAALKNASGTANVIPDYYLFNGAVMLEYLEKSRIQAKRQGMTNFAVLIKLCQTPTDDSMFDQFAPEKTGIPFPVLHTVGYVHKKTSQRQSDNFVELNDTKSLDFAGLCPPN